MKCKNCGNTIPDGSHYCNVCGHYLLKKPKDTISLRKPWQLPSGKWRLQMREYGINVIADTPDACKKKAQAKLDTWIRMDRQGFHEPKPKTVTLGEVVDEYIAVKTAVLSVSTITGYNTIRQNYLKKHWNDDVTNLDTQKIINDEIAANKSAKTIHNAWGLCSSALRRAGYSFIDPTLPRIIKKDKAWLDYNQIKLFLNAIKDEPYEIPALLALHSLRRSEIFGLHPSDYDAEKKIIHVRGALLPDKGGTWVYTKLNKTDTSRRDVPILIDRLDELLKAVDKKREYIVDPTAIKLYRQINKACEFAGLPHTGVHGLRHSMASLASHLNLKKLSTKQLGGWASDKVLDEVYTHNSDFDSDVEKLRAYFNSE